MPHKLRGCHNLFPRVNRTLLFPQWECPISCMGGQLDKRHVYVQCVWGVTTRIAWTSGKLYKPGRISTLENEAEKKRVITEKLHHRSSVCAFQPSPTLFYSTHTYISENKKEKKQIIFCTSALLSSLAVYSIRFGAFQPFTSPAYFDNETVVAIE